MPDFVKEGTRSDEQVESQISSHKEIANAGIVEEQDGERKTLYEQVQESRAKKQEEFNSIIAARNSSYKLDEKSANYYNSLKEKEQLKDLKDREFEKAELEKYKIRKSQKEPRAKNSAKAAVLVETIKVKKNVRNITKRREEVEEVKEKQFPVDKESTNSGIPGMDEYSSSEEED